MNEPATNDATWSGQLTLAPMVALFSGMGGDTAHHAHPVHKVVVGAHGVRIGGVARRGDALAIASSQGHTVLASDRPVLIGYLDPQRFCLSDVALLAERWRGFVPGTDDPEELLGDAYACPQRRLDRRLRDARLALSDGQTVGEVARHVRLSESRLSHLWSEQLGAPPRSFRVWLRLRDAMDEMAVGQNVTRAAMQAGFADAAHFSRTARRVLGIAPSAMGAGRLTLARPLGDCARSNF